MTRLLTAAVAVPLLVLIIMWGPAELFLGLAVVMALAGYREVTKLLGAPPLAVGYFLTALLAASPHPSLPATEYVVVLAVVVIGIAAVMTPGPGSDTVASVSATALGFIYLGAPLGAVSAIRLGTPESDARLWIVFLLAVIMMGDAGAFYAGSALGKHALAPKLSPKKTVEGLVGGLAVSVGTAVGVQKLWMSFVPILHAAALGLVLALLGVLGDLFESLLKRSVGVKDSASFFPGHGGVLDRLDSLLFAAPALFVYLAWIRMS